MEQMGKITANLKLVKQDLHLTQESDKLRICPDCGDTQEFIKKAVIMQGKEKFPETRLPKMCYCQIQAEEKKKNEEEQRQKTARLMEKYKAAYIPPRFMGWEFSKVEDSENKRFCQQYVDCFDTHLLSGRGLLLIGDKGRGKSTLCYCMMKELIKKGYSSRIVSFGQVIRELQSTNAQNSAKTFNQMLSELIQFDFTVIDDFGRETYTDKQLAVAFEFVNELNKNMKCIAITANPERIQFLKSDEFKHRLEFEAILDRLNEMCRTTLTFNGESFRGNVED